MLTASGACFALIRRFEGFRAAPYRCPAGVPTIGCGSTRYADGRPVALTDPPITEAVAVEIMQAAVREYEAAVNRYARVDLQQHEFDALVSFAYNAGAQNLRTSTLLRKLNAGDRIAAAAEFDRWVNCGGQRVPGLIKRRAAERAMFKGAPQI